MSPSKYRKCMLPKILAKMYVFPDLKILLPFLRPGLLLEAGQNLVFNLFSRETLFHEDFFHAGQVIALKFHSIPFYRTAACKL